jgi:acetyl esterase/lipase
MTADHTYIAPPIEPAVIWDLARLMEAGNAAGPDTAALVSFFPELAAAQIRDLEVPGPTGSVDARLYLPGPEVERTPVALVWAHGGAFIAGDLAMPEANWIGLALASGGIPVLSLDYRKALRGNRHPAPSDDILAGWRWAVDNANELGVESGAIHLGGASAGGNLTAGVTKRLRDGAGPLPATLVLAYPMLHAVLPPRSEELAAAMTRSGLHDPFGPAETRALNLNYVGDEAGFADPYAFPANGSVAGFPPTYILMSEFDGLRASGEAFALQLSAAGVSVRAEFEPGAAHGQLNEPFRETGQKSLARIDAWLRGSTRP